MAHYALCKNTALEPFLGVSRAYVLEVMSEVSSDFPVWIQEWIQDILRQLCEGFQLSL